jgi:hypothetical protein
LVRTSKDALTRAYVIRQPANGRTKRDVVSLLKRAIVREMFRLLTEDATPTTTATFGPPPNQNITLTAPAAHLGVRPTVISRLERGRQRNDTIATNYRQWRNAAYQHH